MNKKLFTIAAAFAVSVGVLTAGPASAEDGYLCQTTENAPFYADLGAGGGTDYLFTLSGGRGFRASGTGTDDDQEREWIAGHGAEHPDREGWILRSHTNC